MTKLKAYLEDDYLEISVSEDIVWQCHIGDLGSSTLDTTKKDDNLSFSLGRVKGTIVYYENGIAVGESPDKTLRQAINRAKNLTKKV